MSRPSIAYVAALLSICPLLVACGGGGGGSSTTPPTTQTTPTPTPNGAAQSVASIVVTLGSPNPNAGTAATIDVTVTAKDASGNPITGSATYGNPITLTDSDSSGKFTLSTTSVTSPATHVTAHYDGTSLTQATVGASASGVSNSNAKAAIFAPTPTVVAEYPIPTVSASPGGLIVGPDKNLWFYEDGPTPKLARAAINGYISQLAITTPYNKGLAALTVGPDGNIWGVDNLDEVQVFSTAETLVSQFSVHNSSVPGGTNFAGIVTGPNGSLWLTEFHNGVDQLTPTGAITRFPAPSMPPGGGMMGIVVGSDGNLWAASELDSTIVRVTPSGTATKYATPTGSSIITLTNGKDGNIWFTEIDASKIAKITTSGVITEYPIAQKNGQAISKADGIICDPDGNFWFFDRDNGGMIARFSPNGSVTTEYAPKQANEQPTSLVVGPDGNIWFTTSANSLGKLVY